MICDTLTQTSLRIELCWAISPDMKEQLAIQNLLREKLTEIQRVNPRFSLRAFSKRVGVHVGALTYIMNGKRNVSRDLAERIVRNLALDPQQRSEILSLFPEPRSRQRRDEDPVQPRYLELNAAQFKIAAEWEHFAVMSLARFEDFSSHSSYIANKLGLTEARASLVVRRLVDLGLLEENSEGKLTRSKMNFRTFDDIADVSLKKHHDQTLDLAKESLYRDDVSVRDFTTITMAIDTAKLNQAKELIRKFQDDLSCLLESGRREGVYRLSMQLFPLSTMTPKSQGKARTQ